MSSKFQGEKVLLNALPLKAGGGVQKTITLFKTFSAESIDVSKYQVLVRRGSELESVALDAGFQVITCSSTAWGRLCFELTARWRFPRGALCFTLSGPPMLTTSKYLLNVVECAYSNLLYPEIDFWREVSGLRGLKKKFADFYRRKGIKSADIWIFQTQLLAKRAIELFGFPPGRVCFVSTAPNVNVSKAQIKVNRLRDFDLGITPGTRFLFLSGANPNKRIHLFPKILEHLIDEGIEDAMVVTTLPSGCVYQKRVEEAFLALGLLDRYRNVGPVSPSDVPSLIGCCDIICTLSVLESFSNNFVEAWAMEKPLISTDADWAREVAGDAALYVRIEKPKEAAIQIASVLTDIRKRHLLVERGKMQLLKFSSPRQKLLDYLGILASAKRIGQCSQVSRGGIRW